jgi:hypothetical protein
MVFSTGCIKPYQKEIFEEIGPNETAFVLPLEGANKAAQMKFESIEFLNEKKVAAKRIQIPTRWYKTGRMRSSGQWIPMVRVIKVDRAPVTREWTEEEGSGTSNKNEAVLAESSESIEFGIGVTITAYIKEPNAARFLYFYSGKPLNDIIDLNIRSFVQGFLTKEFAMDDLDRVRKKKKNIFERLEVAAKEKFKEKGISIEYVGAAGGLNYTDEDIQNAINDKFAAEMKKQAAKDERLAAEEFNKAAQARAKKTKLEIDVMNAQANLARAKRWNGELPANVIPASMAKAWVLGEGFK